MNRAIVYSDGGARGNPGPAAIGAVIYDSAEKNILKEISRHIGETTNNQAEYQALIAALKEAAVMGFDSVICYLDSELVVKQLLGKYKVRESGLQPLAAEALKLIKNFHQVDFAHIPREKNQLADKLVNEALDKAGF